MITLSNADARFIIQELELRRSMLLDVGEQLSRSTRGGARAVELSHLDQVLTQLKAGLPQITNPEIVEAIKLVRSL